METAALNIENLTKTYKAWLGPQIQALKELNLKVDPGQIFGLLGPNGAGKTTLVKTLLGIVAPTGGAAEIFGVPIGRPAARRRTGYLPEDHRFPGYLTAAATLDFYGALSGMPRSERKAKIDAALDSVGLLKWKKVKTRKYSKGMKQRLGIAQAIFHDPDLVFLDEPTDGVDPVGRKAIREIILDLNRRGRTVFINSHLLSEVEMICHRVVILHAGEVLREGTIQELTRSEGEYVFCVRGDPGPCMGGIKALCTAVSGIDGGFKASLPREEDVDAIVDLLRKSGIGIRSITPVKVSLEEMFIKVLEEDGAKGGRP